MKNRNWRKEGAVILGIHASGTVAPLSKSQLDELVPDWENARPLGKCLLGVVDLVQICRPKDLPSTLRKHSSVNLASDNWCWVLANPRKLDRPFPAKGNAKLFRVEIPKRLLPEGVCDS